MRHLFAIALIALPFASQAGEVPAEGNSLSLTIYNRDLAVVRDHREATLPAGKSRLTFAGVSPRMLAETARLSGDGIAVSEKSLDFDLITPDNLLRHAVGTEVTLVRPASTDGREERVRARLLSADGPVLDVDGHIEAAPMGRIVYDRLPDGLVTKPTLSMAVDAESAGRHDLDLTYLTQGLGWRAEYLVQLDPSEDKADLQAWAVLTNSSGATFTNAKVSLVAGEVHRAWAAPTTSTAPMRSMAMAAAAPGPLAASAEAEADDQSLSGATLYALPESATLSDRQTRQFALLHADGVAAHRELVAESMPVPFYLQTFDPLHNRDPNLSRPMAVLVLDGSKAKGLPQGLARVFKRDAHGVSQFLGEDTVQRTAKGESLRLVLGRDGDVRVTRAQTAFHPAQPSADAFEAAWRITLTNAKDRAVVVQMREGLPPGTTVVEESAPHEQPEAGLAIWPITVPAAGEAVLTYRVRRTAG